LRVKKIATKGDDIMNISSCVREYLDSRGIKQAFLAERCGWSKQKTSCIVGGKQKMTVNEMGDICEALNLPYDYFYNAAKAAQDTA